MYLIRKIRNNHDNSSVRLKINLKVQKLGFLHLTFSDGITAIKALIFLIDLNKCEGILLAVYTEIYENRKIFFEIWRLISAKKKSQNYSFGSI